MRIRRTYYHLPLADRVKGFLVDLLGKFPQSRIIKTASGKVKGEEMVWLKPTLAVNKTPLDESTLEIIRDFLEENGLKRKAAKLQTKTLHEWSKYTRSNEPFKKVIGLIVIVVDPNGRLKNG